MIHLDLFSGIGGFAYAVDQVFDDVEHIFCEIDPFCQQVLKKHWKGSVIYGDIRELTADTFRSKCGGEDNGRVQDKGRSASEDRRESVQSQDREACPDNFEQGGITPADTEGGQSGQSQAGDRGKDTCGGSEKRIDLLTGGFPCQPFSQAGKRKGTNDNRHLWPAMFRVIQLTKPTWIIAENVRGLLTINGGLVFEQVCLDLEREGYEVQPFIIPAVAVNAPHRRDRVWFVANRRCERPPEQEQQTAGREQCDSNAPDTAVEGREGNGIEGSGRYGLCNRTGENETRHKSVEETRWNQNWLEVATELCGVDDGLPAELDEFKLTKAKHRVERLKSLGNSIVPQVVVQILKAIKDPL